MGLMEVQPNCTRGTRDAIGAREGALATGGDVGAPVVGPTEGAGEGVEQRQGFQAERVAGARVQPWTCLAMGQVMEWLVGSTNLMRMTARDLLV